ncbi:S-adenosyl-L-methionine-dependent methyltransferase [Mycena sanguinolenta]|nr:S-adenosyl-L-methionine-dependent methyltransferase [Mycena sanguinolenta]
MKISASLGLLSDLRAAIRVATLPTLKAVYFEPSLVLRPASVSRIFMAAVWNTFAAPTDQGARATKDRLISHATGAVLDIGAGLGHSIAYLDRDKVTAYIALEPNELMHPAIRARAKAAGFRDEEVLILRCGAEDPRTILVQLDGAGIRVDTMLSVLTLCSIPDPQETLARLIREVLAPGGRLLFYEHVLSPRSDVAWWQRFWTPVWRLAFDGCCLDRPTHLWVEAIEDVGPDGQSINMWSQREVWGKEGEPEEHLFWHRVGEFVKHSD